MLKIGQKVEHGIINIFFFVIEDFFYHGGKQWGGGSLQGLECLFR